MSYRQLSAQAVLYDV